MSAGGGRGRSLTSQASFSLYRSLQQHRKGCEVCPRENAVTGEEEAGWEAVSFQNAPQISCYSHPAATKFCLVTLAKDVCVWEECDGPPTARLPGLSPGRLQGQL